MAILVFAIILAIVGIFGGSVILATFSLLVLAMFSLGLLFINPIASITFLIIIGWMIKQLSYNKERL